MAGVSPGLGKDSGKRSVNVLPRPTALSTCTDPWWAVMMCLTMARPRPVPPNSRLRALSTR